MIIIITGAPGSGKTYYAVHHLVRKHFSYDKVLREYLPKHKVTICTNIDELRLDHMSLKESLKGMSLESFFTVAHQTAMVKEHSGMVYMIDEVQSYFHFKYSDNDVLFFFEYHRHLGIDFYLMCPDSANLARRLRTLADYEIHAATRAVRVFNEFRYTKIVAGERAGHVVLRPSSSIFRLYRSMMKSETTKPKSLVRKYFVFALVGILLLPLSVFWIIHYFFGAATHTPKNVKKFFGSKAPVASPGQRFAPVAASPSSLPQPAVNVSAPSPSVFSPEDFFNRYQLLLFVVAEKKTTAYTADGVFYSPEELLVLKPSMIFVGGKIYIPRLSRSQASEYPAHRAGASEAVGAGAPGAPGPGSAVGEQAGEPTGPSSYVIPAKSSYDRKHPHVYTFFGGKK